MLSLSDCARYKLGFLRNDFECATEGQTAEVAIAYILFCNPWLHLKSFSSLSRPCRQQRL